MAASDLHADFANGIFIFSRCRAVITYIGQSKPPSYFVFSHSRTRVSQTRREAASSGLQFNESSSPTGKGQKLVDFFANLGA